MGGRGGVSSLRAIPLFAIYSRLVLFAFSLACGSFIADYDTSAHIPAPTLVAQSTAADRTVETVFGHLVRWDGVYFLRIAEHGYEFEQTHAFMPLYPLLMRALASGTPSLVSHSH